MRMSKAAAAVAAMAGGLSLALAPTASATDPAFPDDPYGFHDYQDRTDYLVTPLDPGAIIGDKTTRPLVISPYGRTQKIECRGDGHYVGITDCRQYDTSGVAHDLKMLNVFARAVWVYV